MQHYGCPTRLLDWSESPLVALYFALENVKFEKEVEENPVVYVLHPIELNRLSNMDYFPNTWSRHDRKCFYKKLNYNSGVEHFRLAFHTEKDWKRKINLKIVKLPIAIQSNFFDKRLSSQKSCFTIHGSKKEDFYTLFKDTILVKKSYYIKMLILKDRAKEIYNRLNIIGITPSTIYTDFGGLAKELKERFGRKL